MLCNCPLGVQALEFPRLCRPGSTTTCVLPRATQHELASNLQMDVICAKLWRLLSWKPNCDPKVTAANELGLGPLSETYRGWVH